MRFVSLLCAAVLWTFFCRIWTFPSVGASRPERIRSSVDFPHPDGPSREKKDPFSIFRSTPFNPTAPPGYILSRPATSMSYCLSSMTRFPLLPVPPTHALFLARMCQVCRQFSGFTQEQRDGAQCSFFRISSCGAADRNSTDRTAIHPEDRRRAAAEPRREGFLIDGIVVLACVSKFRGQSLQFGVRVRYPGCFEKFHLQGVRNP